MTVVGMIWYGRDRPYVADDLRCVLTPSGSVAPLENALGAGSGVRRFLGLPVSRPVLSHTGSVLGWVRPLDDELYQFRPSKGVRIEGTDAARGQLQRD